MSALIVNLFSLPYVITTDKAALAIKCYECSVQPKRQQNGTVIERLCSKFDESDYYEVDCPFSTMCKKRLYRYQLINKVQESIERGCADQKNDSMVKRRWIIKKFKN